MQLNPSTPLLAAIDFEVLLRLGSAALIGLLLGVDRERLDKAAGLRTHGLVCFAAAAMTVSMLSLHYQLGAEGTDALRVFEAAGAFVGFLGAGLVIFTKGRVKNLTTAAHLWLTAVIGIACGAGQWPVAMIAVIVSIVMLVLLRFVEPDKRPNDDESR